MWSGVDTWAFVAGLGLFLLGMYMLEQGLRGVGSRTMKRFLQEQTSSPLRGVLTGTISTAILQSSSLVGLIMLAFVGAGILELRNALGVILGSNLGTTFTGWIVTFIGFKLNLTIMANPLLAIGAMGTVFLKQDSRIYYTSNLVLGFGLLLMGLGEMTGGFASLSENFDVTIFQGHNILIYFISGALFTALIQSSSASMMIILSAINAGVINLHEAAPLVIGADLGTTSTVLLGALKGTIEKRRVALSHFFFNLVTDIFALILVPVLLYVILNIFIINDPLYSLVVFHSLFNILGIALFMPFIDRFIHFLQRLVPEQHDKAQLGIHIKQVPSSVTDAAITAIRKELFNLIIQSVRLNIRCFKINPDKVFPAKLADMIIEHNLYEDDYSKIKRASGEFLGYTYSVQSQTRHEDDIRELTQINHAIRNVSYATKFIKDIRHNLAEFRHRESDYIQIRHQEFAAWFEQLNMQLLDILTNSNPELFAAKHNDLLAELRKKYENNLQKFYIDSGENQIDDEQTSSLINVNRAIYQSTQAILNTLLVLNEANDAVEADIVTPVDY